MKSYEELLANAIIGYSPLEVTAGDYFPYKVFEEQLVKCKKPIIITNKRTLKMMTNSIKE